VQTQEFLDHKEQEEADGAGGIQEVLQVLLEAHDSQGNPVAIVVATAWRGSVAGLGFVISSTWKDLR
jgi:hypothetical protein